MRRFLTRMLAFTLAVFFVLGMVPMAFADQDVRIRDTAYSETLGLRAAVRSYPRYSWQAQQSG